MIRTKQHGFVHTVLLALIFIVVIGFAVVAYLYVQDQNDKNAALNQQIQELEEKQKIPDDWQAFELTDTASSTLPDDYGLEQTVNGTYVFRSQRSEIQIAVHVDSLPSINHSFSYESYCQLNDGEWTAYTNVNDIQEADMTVNSCAQITPGEVEGAQYYSLEELEGYNYHVAYAVEAGGTYYVVNYNKYFNNYGETAIRSAAGAQKVEMLDIVQKIYSANN